MDTQLAPAPTPAQVAAWRSLWAILLQPDDDPAIADMSAADEILPSSAADNAPGTAAHQAAIAAPYARQSKRRNGNKS